MRKSFYLNDEAEQLFQLLKTMLPGQSAGKIIHRGLQLLYAGEMAARGLADPAAVRAQAFNQPAPRTQTPRTDRPTLRRLQQFERHDIDADDTQADD